MSGTGVRVGWRAGAVGTGLTGAAVVTAGCTVGTRVAVDTMAAVGSSDAVGESSPHAAAMTASDTATLITNIPRLPLIESLQSRVVL